MKRCKKCEQELDTSFFSRRKKSKDGLQSTCKHCHSNRQKESYWNGGDKNRFRDRLLRQKYGINLEQYEQMLAAQGGVCAMCESDSPGRSRHGTDKCFAVDHDHRTGAVRALLCQKCNLALGLLGDDPKEAGMMLLDYARITNEKQ